MTNQNNSSLIQEFIIESLEGLSVLSEALTALEKNPNDKELLNKIYRVIHTIKGGSRFLRLNSLEEIAHSLEGPLDLLREGKLQLTAELTDILLEGLDIIHTHIKTLESKGQVEDTNNSSFVEKITKHLELATNSSQPIVTSPVLVDEPSADSSSSVPPANSLASNSENNSPQTQSTHEIEAQINTSANLESPLDQNSSIIQSELESSKIESNSLAQNIFAEQSLLESNFSKTNIQSEITIPNPFVNTNSSEQLSSNESEAKPIAAAKSPTTETATTEEKSGPEKNISDSVVRVNVNLLDKIMNVVGELVLTRNQILQFANRFENIEFHRLSGQLNSITTELQSDIMTTRMQPIGSILSRFERIVRDMSRELDKRINLKIEGKETELDKTLLESIKDPLTHMVRNAVDHGMETTAERKTKGKPAEGTLLIKAYHEGGQVTIEIKDDGRGIQSKRVLQKAIEKGLLTKEKASQLSEKDIFGLIFMPGFSTAEKVTNISGRGVGMDVVRTNIERIGGQIEVISQENEGTTFKLKIPLTLAIIPTLVVEDKAEFFAIPQVNLVELVLLEGEKLNLIEKIKDTEFFRLRGQLIPLLRLSQVLNLGESSEQISSTNIVVLNSDGRVFGLIVNNILDTQEIVVKPLSKQLKSIGLYAGATIMGDGRVALILDTQGLVNKYKLELEENSQTDEEAKEESRNELQDVLLFKLNTSGSFAVSLSVVTRLEDFRRDQIEYMGKIPVIQYRGQPMPLVHLNNVMGYSKDADFDETMPVFVVTLSGKCYGFVVSQILDITTTNFEIKTAQITSEGILGSLFISEKVVSILDIYWVANKVGIYSNPKATYKYNEKKPLILLAEDTPFYRKLAEDTIKSAGYDLIIAHDGAQALKMMNEKFKEISILVSDIEMPNMTGLELIKNVRSDKRFNHIPAIALTSKYSDQDIRTGIMAGFNKYLEKFKKDEIVVSIKEFLDNQKAG